jgi:type I restriction enzyme, R subunit
MPTEAERVTRRQRIDPQLVQSGWRITRYEVDAGTSRLSRVAVEEYGTKNGPVDYALCNAGHVRAVVEAKKVTLGPQGVLVQAERYSKGIGQLPRYRDEFGVPFLYSTNGEVIWFHDVRHGLNRSRRVSGFHTPAALEEMLARDLDAETANLAGIPENRHMRPYQVEANTTIEQAIRDRKRKLLVAMATGTGKTLTMVNEVYRLMKSGAARRVLFLVDRKALAAQAVRAFASFEAEPGLKFDKIYPVYSQRFQQSDLDEGSTWDPNVMPNALLTSPKLGDAFVYVCTIQRMAMNLLGGEGALTIGDESVDADVPQLDIPIHAFDLIIADECHRGYSAKDMSVWRTTLDHFDAVKVGLTATPAAHTVAYFENLVYRYEYDRAVREGHLVDYDVVRVRSNVRMNGVFLGEGEQVDQVDPETGTRQLDLLEDERSFDATEVERKITAPDSNRKIIEELKAYADEHERQHGRLPKMLVFAANDLPHTSHADQLVDLARDIFGRGDSFVAKITGRVDRPLQRIREFRNRPNPGVVVTVDLLTTGVDIPDLEYIVFLRPVKSRILFEQIGNQTHCPKEPDDGQPYAALLRRARRALRPAGDRVQPRWHGRHRRRLGPRPARADGGRRPARSGARPAGWSRSATGRRDRVLHDIPAFGSPVRVSGASGPGGRLVREHGGSRSRSPSSCRYRSRPWVSRIRTPRLRSARQTVLPSTRSWRPIRATDKPRS